MYARAFRASRQRSTNSPLNNSVVVLTFVAPKFSFVSNQRPIKYRPMVARHISISRIMLAAVVCLLLVTSAPATSSLQERTVEFSYIAEVHDIPSGS